MKEILWYDIVDDMLYSMEDWRESLQYKRRCDMIMDLRNQEMELASPGQGISVEEWQNQNRGFSSKQFSSLGRLAGDL